MRRSTNTSLGSAKRSRTSAPNSQTASTEDVKTIYAKAILGTRDPYTRTDEVRSNFKQAVELARGIPELENLRERALTRLGIMSSINTAAVFQIDIPLPYEVLFNESDDLALHLRRLPWLGRMIINRDSIVDEVRNWVEKNLSNVKRGQAFDTWVAENIWDKIFKHIVAHRFEEIDLSSNGITEFPDRFDWSRTHLEVVKLDYNTDLANIPLSLFKARFFRQAELRHTEITSDQLYICLGGDNSGQIVVFPKEDLVGTTDSVVECLKQTDVAKAIEASEAIRGILPRPIEEVLFNHLVFKVFQTTHQ